MLIREKVITEIAVDPNWETADIDVTNNYWPARVIKSPLEIFKDKKANMMRDYQEKLKPINDEPEHKDETGNQ